jgi:hypothetical protein
MGLKKRFLIEKLTKKDDPDIKRAGELSTKTI